MTGTQKNILPYDGGVYYHGAVFSDQEADQFYEALYHKIAWRHDEAMMFGKHIVTKRKVAWYADRPFEYTYSKITKSALPWTQELRSIKQQIEALSNETFNSCLLNLYHSGEEGMAWHSDDEKDLKENAAIASVSFGTKRKFAFKHKKTKERIDLMLDHGSLLMMGGEIQKSWWHRLPPTKTVNSPRINLTFRTML